MRFEVDDGHKVLNELVEVHKGLALADASEAETRFKVIDWVLRKVLGWTDDDIVVEERTSLDGATNFIDYLITSTAALIIVEAKRAQSFLLPSNRKAGVLRGFLSEGDVGEAIRQGRDYCISRSAQFAVVTNGSAWIVFPAFRSDGIPLEETEAIIFRSLEDVQERFVEFWELLSRQRVIEGSLSAHFFSTKTAELSRRPITLLESPSYRVGRNSVYPYIERAVITAFTDEGLLADAEALQFCYVASAERMKFDSRLQMYLTDIKPKLDHAAVRVRGPKRESYFDDAIGESSCRLPRFFLILGPVGAGKTTFLRYTKGVSARDAIDGKIVWFIVDFKRATRHDDPRKVIYAQLLESIVADTAFSLGNWEKSIEPAYKDMTESLRRGHLSPIARASEDGFQKHISELIDNDYRLIEPYVDRILRYSQSKRPGYLVIDNVDQIEDENIQADIFSEAQAIAQRIGFNVVMALRDSTYLKGQHSARFDAFQFESIYIDPPNVLPVISRRLQFARKLMSGHSVDIALENGPRFHVDDLGAFFDVVAASILSDDAAFMFEVLSANNIRRGISLVREFLASGHVTADAAIKAYLTDRGFRFGYHDVFKGAILGNRKFFREEESMIPNLYCSKLGKRNLQLLRHRLLYFFVSNAAASTYEGTMFDTLMEPLGQMGVSSEDVTVVIKRLLDTEILRVVDGRPYSDQSPLYPTRLAGYMLNVLGARFNFTEMCLLDASIYDDATWERIVSVTNQIQKEQDTSKRIGLRIERIRIFFEYLKGIEERWVVEANRRNLPSVWTQQVLLHNVLPALEKDFEAVQRSADRQEVRKRGYASSS